MKNTQLSAFLVATLAVSLSNVSAEGTRKLTDVDAYNKAKNAFIRYKTTYELGNLESEWSDGMKILAFSNSRTADVFLSELALFSLDGAIGEEFTCAASKRGTALSKELIKRLKTFDVSNKCADAVKSLGLKVNDICASRVEFARLVNAYRKMPQKDTGESACSY